MPRQLRVEFPGAIYHVMSRGDQGENVYHDDIDRQDFLKTLAEACKKTAFQVHAYCLMPNHFHLVLETPNANLVEGMRWLLSSYTLRLNHRRKRSGHVFSGRYKAINIDSSGNGYLKTACDYVHLNPVRASMLAAEDRLFAYPWSSIVWYLAAPDHRPAWIRTDRLLGEHGIQHDTPAGRAEFENRMEARRRAGEDEETWKPLRRGWCLGGEDFKKALLEKMEGKIGPHHSGELVQETALAKGERIIAEELQRLHWNQADLLVRLKGDPAKMEIARRLREETTLTVNWISARLHLGTPKSARSRIQKWERNDPQPVDDIALL